MTKSRFVAAEPLPAKARQVANRQVMKLGFCMALWCPLYRHSVSAFHPADLNLKFGIKPFASETLGLAMGRVLAPGVVIVLRIKFDLRDPLAIRCGKGFY